MREILAKHWEEFSGDFQMVVTENFAEYEELTERIDRMDARINARVASTEECKRLMQISGIGPLAASSFPLCLCHSCGQGQDATRRASPDLVRYNKNCKHQ
jgi:hypothetical protein